MSLNFFRGQISELQKYYDVTLISSPSDELVIIANREKVNSTGIEMKREISVFNDLVSLVKLILLFIVEKPYVVHCNTPKASLLGLLAGKITNVPVRIYYIHGLRYEGAQGLKRKLLIAIEKISCSCATEIIAVSYGIKKIVEEELTNKKVDIIKDGSVNGMFIEDFDRSKYNLDEIRNEFNLVEEDFVFGFVGRIVSDKGINELVDAFQLINKQYENVKLLLVGFYEEKLDPLLPSTIQNIKSNPNIIETGFQKDVKKCLSIMNVFVSPSYREGFGLSLLEANLMGKPVIATNITGYSEIVMEGKNGFLVPARDLINLKAKMEWAYNNQESLVLMSDSCIDEVVKKFNHKEVMEEALNYYKKYHRN